jgi:hypothetical protein
MTEDAPQVLGLGHGGADGIVVVTARTWPSCIDMARLHIDPTAPCSRRSTSTSRSCFVSGTSNGLPIVGCGIWIRSSCTSSQRIVATSFFRKPDSANARQNPSRMGFSTHAIARQNGPRSAAAMDGRWPRSLNHSTPMHGFELSSSPCRRSPRGRDSAGSQRDPPSVFRSFHGSTNFVSLPRVHPPVRPLSNPAPRAASDRYPVFEERP